MAPGGAGAGTEARAQKAQWPGPDALLGGRYRFGLANEKHAIILNHKIRVMVASEELLTRVLKVLRAAGCGLLAAGSTIGTH